LTGSLTGPCAPRRCRPMCWGSYWRTRSGTRG
jgi:hypothetical protein